MTAQLMGFYGNCAEHIQVPLLLLHCVMEGVLNLKQFSFDVEYEIHYISIVYLFLFIYLFVLFTLLVIRGPWTAGKMHCIQIYNITGHMQLREI